jgi:hypothetical protein
VNTGVCYRVTTEQGHSCPERKPLYLPEVSAVLSAVLLLPSTVPEPEKSLGTHLVSCHWSHGRLSGDCEGQAEKKVGVRRGTGFGAWFADGGDSSAAAAEERQALEVEGTGEFVLSAAGRQRLGQVRRRVIPRSDVQYMRTT